MTNNLTVIVPPPQAPCNECVEGARHQDETFGLVWCEHTRYGGVYQVEIAQWSIVGPFDDEACITALPASWSTVNRQPANN